MTKKGRRNFFSQFKNGGHTVKGEIKKCRLMTKKVIRNVLS